MLKALIDFLLNRKGHPTQHDTATITEAPVAPYKIETLPVVKAAEPAPASDHVRVEATAPAKKPAAKKVAAKKPAADKKPVTKTPAKPRKTKAPKQ